jgi:hypothetical protein
VMDIKLVMDVGKFPTGLGMEAEAATPSILIRFHFHQQNVNWSRNNIDSSRTLQATSPVLLSTSRCSHTPLELSKVLSDSSRAISGATENTCSYGGTFRMRCDLTIIIFNFWGS